ncbi:hypothetical protein DH2020_016718 [Rehmannia glutinosa]|uniref:BHLH domain-containing protein n=1 Tax=Rehmannia glutinosa TaxID=99300 RepID=A0ABR0WQM5_REHGL
MEFSGNNNSSQNNSGLLRYRSAPTSLLANYTNGAERLNSGFCSIETNSMHVMENDDNSGNRFAAMNSQLPPQYPRQSGAQLGNSIVMDYEGQGKMGSNLMRQNSSPAGLFSHLTSQNAICRLCGGRLIGSYRVADGFANGDLSTSSSRLRNRVSFSSEMPSSLGMLSRITEHQKELDDDQKLFANTQNMEPGNRPHMLSHHLSLPKTSGEMGAMEKLLHFQDTVPCKIRAKRGCATHPRSIAERVRRTRISERMRKLQELVPNMDKQTNTADMLDLAVDYIKGLQKQYKDKILVTVG